nr:hypothetical protein [Tanacetum cinerariifolium]
MLMDSNLQVKMERRLMKIQEKNCNDQEKENNVNNTNNVNIVTLNVNVAGTNKDNELLFDPNMPALKDVSIFNFLSDDDDDGTMADMNNLDTTIQVSPIPTTRIHKDHPLDQLIKDLQSAIQTRKMSKNLKKHGFVSTIQQRTNHKDLQNCLFACFLSQEEPKKKFGFTKVKTTSTPMETKKPLFKDEDGKEVDVHMCRSMIGSLMYLTSSIPDIIFAFWSTAMAKTINGEAQLHARVDGKKIIITEASIRRDLQVADEEGVNCLLNSIILEQLALIGLVMPTDPHHKPTILQSSSSQPQKTHKTRKPTRKVTQVPQPSDLMKHVADEAVHKELDDSCSQGTDSGGGPRCQESMRDTTTQTRFESISKRSNISLLAKGNTLQSNEDRMKLNELMALCITLQNKILELVKTKTSQHNEIASLKRRVKKLEKRNRSKAHKLNKLHKVGLTARVESLDEESLGADASKQGRIEAIDTDEDITLVND